ncbi:hypothetical protein Hypma_014575 [Hypsizygus marmoreus]|uniref:Uncharacterized protein n=1 Tax=Hypsizygus marmoreus TaxID=39966 RepID=A0A369JJ89_HYPMA|nr:hypothetical protein Hypma_014575 [Hypsizygus marmoreus]
MQSTEADLTAAAIQPFSTHAICLCPDTLHTSAHHIPTLALGCRCLPSSRPTTGAHYYSSTPTPLMSPHDFHPHPQANHVQRLSLEASHSITTGDASTLLFAPYKSPSATPRHTLFQSVPSAIIHPAGS